MSFIFWIIVVAVAILAFKVLKGAVKVAATAVVIAFVLYAITHLLV